MKNFLWLILFLVCFAGAYYFWSKKPETPTPKTDEKVSDTVDETPPAMDLNSPNTNSGMPQPPSEPQNNTPRPPPNNNNNNNNDQPHPQYEPPPYEPMNPPPSYEPMAPPQNFEEIPPPPPFPQDDSGFAPPPPPDDQGGMPPEGDVSIPPPIEGPDDGF